MHGSSPKNQSPARSIKAVVFDMDGLMFNTEDIYTLVGEELSRRRGRKFTAELKKEMMGLKPKPAHEVMIRAFDLRETWEELADESNALFIGLLDKHLAPMTGLMELLDALESAGIPKAVATSSCRTSMEACLEHFDLLRRFSFCLAAEDVVRGKPDAEIYLTAAARFRIDPKELLVLEDSQNGCKAASAAGAFTVAAPAGHSQTHDFTSASLIVKSLSDPGLYAALGLTAC
jgi:HAD superfamily hydrolase (TIGR01509 family)